MRLIVSGISASGKTCFSQWLEARGYERYASDEPSWSSVVDAIDGTGPNVVLDWFIPPSAIGVARRVVSEKGFVLWWFDGDRDAARQAYQSRKNHPVPDDQIEYWMSQIDDNWELYQELFRDRRLDVVFPGPRFLSNEDRLAAIVEKEKGY